MTESESMEETPVTTAATAMLRRRIIAGVCVSGMLLQIGCYRTIPIVGANEQPSGTVSVTLNDRGRVAVSPRFGLLVDRLEGRITAADAANVTVAVSTAVDVKGGTVNWAGERATIPREGINSIGERKLSKGRTWAVVGAIAAGLGVLFAIIKKAASNGASEEGPGPNPI